MNNPLPQNDLFNILTIHNPSKEPFEIYYNGELHKVIQPNRAVRVVKMVGARTVKHLVDRMIRQEKGAAYINDPVLRAKWTAVILIDTESNGLPQIPTMEQQARKMTDELNTKSDVDLHMESQQITPQTQEAVAVTAVPRSEWKFDPTTGEPIKPQVNGVTPEQIDLSKVQIQEDVNTDVPAGVAMPEVPLPHPDSETNTMLDGMRNSAREHARVLKVDDDGIDEAPQVPEVKTGIPSRDVLLNFAQNTLMMNINDPKTKATLDAMTDEQLAQELKYNETAE